MAAVRDRYEGPDAENMTETEQKGPVVERVQKIVLM